MSSQDAATAGNRNDPPDPASEAVVEVFRLNGQLLAAGDQMVAPLGLTSARWQVLGAVALAPYPGPIAHVARSMGLTRQNVRRIVGDLAAEGMLDLVANPHHRRAPLVVMTAAGAAAYQRAMALWSPIAAAMVDGIPREELDATVRTLRTMRDRLERVTATDEKR